MEKNVKERVIFAMETLGVKPYTIAKFYGLSDRTVNDQINGNSKIGIATIEALLAYRPDLSPEWLITGKGEMLRDGKKVNKVNNKTVISQAGTNNVQKNFPASDSDDALCGRLLDEMREQRETYQSNIDRLLRIIENMQKQ